MPLIFGLFYTLLFFCYIATAFFIVFHLLRYSLDRRSALFATTLFLIVFALLLFINAITFFSLPLEDLLLYPSL